jgi:hypothetical protein
VWCAGFDTTGSEPPLDALQKQSLQDAAPRFLAITPKIDPRNISMGFPSVHHLNVFEFNDLIGKFGCVSGIEVPILI